MFSYQFSCDVFVEDMHQQTKLLVDGLGLRPPSPKAIVTDSPEAHATMLRLQKSFREAPTRLEIIQPAQSGGHWNAAHIQQAWRQQASRPVRFHNIVVVGDLKACVAKFQQRGVPHIVDSSLTFERLWTGISPQHIETYDPSFDAGLRIEILPFDAFPVDPSTGDDDADADPIRVLSRSFLTADIDATVRTLERTFDWSPRIPIHDSSGDNGARRAVYGFAHDRSAQLELLQPSASGETGAFFKAHGAGPFGITFLVRDLSPWAERLAKRGIASREGSHQEYGKRLVIDPGPLGPVRVELVSQDPGAASSGRS